MIIIWIETLHKHNNNNTYQHNIKQKKHPKNLTKNKIYLTFIFKVKSFL